VISELHLHFRIIPLWILNRRGRPVFKVTRTEGETHTEEMQVRPAVLVQPVISRDCARWVLGAPPETIKPSV